MLYEFNSANGSLAAAAAHYAREGAESGDPVILVLPHQCHCDVKDLLPGYRELKRSRKLVLTTPQRIYIDKDRFSWRKAVAQWEKTAKLLDPHGNIRVFGAGGSEIADRYSMLKMIEYDASVNRCLGVKMAVCAYDTSVFPDDLMNEVAACHPFLWDGVSVRQNENYLPPDIFFQRFYGCSTYKFIWSAEPANCREARVTVGEIAARMPFDLDEIDDIMLAVGEAFTNAIRHGSPMGSDNNVTVGIICSAEYITVDVTDEGCGITHKPKKIDPTEPGGKGLFLMRELCDQVEHFIHGNGCTVRLKKHIKRSRF